jgi:hypothetical protein
MWQVVITHLLMMANRECLTMKHSIGKVNITFIAIHSRAMVIMTSGLKHSNVMQTSTNKQMCRECWQTRCLKYE